ncbi:oxidoreductase [Pacificimonas flava]|uniref:Oxidoreductase n=2 Tax=Pacificimonas TaxID=1960290 RepID=A0A219B365_9SPHN|nr:MULTISPECIES: SDR family oxidoreductase [Pacificimonas]MBZ6377530.1 SDR family oxidoreductase [Pacificimonas aurantium]OWV32777.1 oxidoreductase [Pacificimonas flava]
MKVLIAGATGHTGLRLTRQLAEAGHTPVALVRESSDTSSLPEGTELRQGDLTDLQGGECDGVEAVVFAAGSGSSTGPDMTDKVDRDGAKRLVDIAAKSDADKFIMLSAVGAGNPPFEGDLAHYMDAKHEADEHLMASGLTYTIVRPVALTQEDGDRKVRLGDDVDVEGKAARGDVAAIMAQALVDPRLENRAFHMESLAA